MTTWIQPMYLAPEILVALYLIYRGNWKNWSGRVRAFILMWTLLTAAACVVAEVVSLLGSTQFFPIPRGLYAGRLLQCSIPIASIYLYGPKEQPSTKADASVLIGS